MNPNIINIGNGKVLTDPRYGSVVALDVPGCVPLHKLDLAIASVHPGAVSPAHYHQQTEEIYFVTEGVGEMTIDGVTTAIGPGDCIRIPTYAVHSIRAGDAGVRFVVVTSPPYAEGDDHEVATATVERPTPLPRRIAVVAGTHRRDSVSGKIARQICAMYREIGAETDLIDLAELPESIFGAASYNTRYDENTPLARRFIMASGIHVICAEYNGGMPAPLKHALDIVPYKASFNGKPVAMTGVAAGDFGAVRALDQLGAVFAYRCANIYGKRVFIKNVDEAPFDEKGHLNDRAIVERLRDQVVGFVGFVRRLSV
jgi:NAD(P)H-dependent FMN reductase/mannose-6-phosphate isomerase-like protein (cupin superfamily)